MDASVGHKGRRVRGAAVTQAFGDQNVLQGEQARTDICRKGDGERDANQLFSFGAPVTGKTRDLVTAAVEEIQEKREPKRGDLGRGASQNQRTAGCFDPTRSKQGKQIHGANDLYKLLKDLCRGIFIGAAHGGEIAAKYRGERNQRQ